jgi:phospholipid/cholesterol/gamma-HCH transport system substrate-binding protein
MQGAWKVGLLVVVFFALLFGAYSLLGENLLTPKTDRYYIDFADAGGVTVGTPVLMSGVKIGQVATLSLDNPKVARMTIAVDRTYPIPAGSTAQIRGSLIGIGQQPVMIIPPDKLTGENLKPRSILQGVSTSALESALPEAKKTIAELDRTLVATRELLQDERLKSDIVKVLETSAKTLAQFGEVADRANTMLGQNQVSIQRAVASAATAMSDLQKSTAIVAKFAEDPRWRQQSTAILDSLAKTSTKASKLVDNLNSFVTDPKLREPINQTVANTAKITETGTRIAANTEEMSKNGIVMTQKALEIEDKAKVLEDDAKGVLDKLQNVFGSKHGLPLLGNISANLDVIRESHPGHTRTDINATIPIGKENLHLGLFDAFESNKINAELGRPFAQGSEFLYGIYASKPAVGVDFRLAPRVFLRGDFYDVNSPRADLRARIEFGNGFYGWLGINQAFRTNAPLIGLGFRK